MLLQIVMLLSILCAWTIYWLSLPNETDLRCSMTPNANGHWPHSVQSKSLQMHFSPCSLLQILEIFSFVRVLHYLFKELFAYQDYFEIRSLQHSHMNVFILSSILLFVWSCVNQFLVLEIILTKHLSHLLTMIVEVLATLSPLLYLVLMQLSFINALFQQMINF